MEERKKYLRLNDIEAYRIAFELSNFVWGIVVEWKQFERNTIGSQFVRAIDSISANIAEGFGRYNKKDKIRFYRISQASIFEALDWNQKAKARELISEETYKHIFNELKKLPKALNSLIKFTNEKLKI